MMEQKNVILSAKDVEIQFSLRGKKLNAIRKCSLDLYEGRLWRLLESPVPENPYLPNPLWECWTQTDRSPAVRSCLRKGHCKIYERKRMADDPWKEDRNGYAGSNDFSEPAEENRQTDSGEY